MSYKSYSDSTLQSMTKSDLIGHIRCLEHNWAGAEERLAVKVEDNMKLLFTTVEEFNLLLTDIGELTVYRCNSCNATFIDQDNNYRYCPYCGRMIKE